MGERVSVDYARSKLREWQPFWQVDSWGSEKIMSVYRKERQKLVPQIMAAYGLLP